MLKFLFGGVSLKGLVMKRLNAKIADYQERLDVNLEELNETRKFSLKEAWNNYIDIRYKIEDNHKYNTEKIVDTHVTNLLNKII